MNKIRISVYVDEEVYKQFKVQSILKNENISQRLNEYMKKEIQKGKKADV